LLSAGGRVEYVTPKEGVDTWILLVAGIGLAVSVLAVAALTAYAGPTVDRSRALGLCFSAALLAAGAVAVGFLTPEDWRIGVGLGYLGVGCRIGRVGTTDPDREQTRHSEGDEERSPDRATRPVPEGISWP
ncbi:MAG: hypothetical protein ACKORA_08265, partial [Solirubrobacterales bacterium]